MNKIECICTYCGVSVIVKVRSEQELLSLKCKKCDWHKFKFKEVKEGKLDPYHLDTPFPEDKPTKLQDKSDDSVETANPYKYTGYPDWTD